MSALRDYPCVELADFLIISIAAFPTDVYKRQVMDATMNGFTMVTSKKDTLYISTMDRNIALEKGLLIGDTLEVSYTIRCV